MTKVFRALLALAVLVSAQVPAQPPAKPLALTHVTVIDLVSKAPLPDQTVIITGDRITALGPAKRIKVPANAEVLDATGKFLMPGLWDMHVHLTNQPDQTISRELLLPLLVAFGVTGVRENLSLAVGDLVKRVKQHTSLPVAVGFGISTPEQVREVCGYADAAVVGSRLVLEIENNLNSPHLVEQAARLARDLKQAS